METLKTSWLEYVKKSMGEQHQPYNFCDTSVYCTVLQVPSGQTLSSLQEKIQRPWMINNKIKLFGTPTKLLYWSGVLHYNQEHTI